MTIRSAETQSKMRSVLLLVLGAMMVGVTTLAGLAQQAEAVSSNKIVFVSTRTTGAGVNNPTGDAEIFTMNTDGTGGRQLTFNEVSDYNPSLSPNGAKVVYVTYGKQTSNPEGDNEVYLMSTLDGSAKKNLTNNGADVSDHLPVFSPDGTKVAYVTYGKQTSNPEGDDEIYRMSALDGSGKKNLTNNGEGVSDHYPRYSPGGGKIFYQSSGAQTSNPEGDYEVYRMDALDGSAKKNLTDNGEDVDDFNPDPSPDGARLAYESRGIQDSNPEGDNEIYRMNTVNGGDKKNLTNNGSGISDSLPAFSRDGTKIAYQSSGVQTTNPEGDYEVYRLNAGDGRAKKNLTNNGLGVQDYAPDFSPGGKGIVYEGSGEQQTLNPEGDSEIFRMSALDGAGKKNLSNNGLDIYDGIYPD